MRGFFQSRAGNEAVSAAVGNRSLTVAALMTQVPLLIAVVAAAQPAAARVPASAPANAPATSQAATAPVRNPAEEAELAIRLADDGRAADALRLARSAYERDMRLEVARLAMGVALDAAGQGLEAMTYLKQYNDTAVGRDRDWRGHARLGNLYLRSRNWLLAAREIAAAERAPLFPAVDPIARVNLLVDKTEANLNLADRKGQAAALAAVNEIAAYIEGSDAVRKQPRLVLACARSLYSVEGYRKNAGDDAYRWVVDIAVPAATARAQAAGPDDRKAWGVVSECYRLAQQVRDYELKSLNRAERSDEASADVREKLTDEQKKARLPRSERHVRLPRDLASLELPMANVSQRLHRIDALEAARAAVAVYADNKDFKYQMAELQQELGDPAGAAATLGLILKQDPSDRRAQDALARIAASQPTTAPTTAPATTQATTAPAAPQPSRMDQAPRNSR